MKLLTKGSFCFESFSCGVAFVLAIGKEKSNLWLVKQFVEGNLKPINNPFKAYIKGNTK